MRARLLIHERRLLAEDAFVEMVVWQVTPPVRRSAHGFKYRLALVVNGVCVLRYDNEAGKGASTIACRLLEGCGPVETLICGR